MAHHARSFPSRPGMKATSIVSTPVMIAAVSMWLILLSDSAILWGRGFVQLFEEVCAPFESIFSAASRSTGRRSLWHWSFAARRDVFRRVGLPLRGQTLVGVRHQETEPEYSTEVGMH